MGRGGRETFGANLLYGEPHRRRAAATLSDEKPSDLGTTDEEIWRAGDKAIWYPRWAPGPVDVVIEKLPRWATGTAEVRITTADIEETDEIWAARLSELDPV